MKRKPSFKFTIKHLIMLLLVGSLLYYIVGLFTVREGMAKKAAAQESRARQKSCRTRQESCRTRQESCRTRQESCRTRQESCRTRQESHCP